MNTRVRVRWPQLRQCHSRYAELLLQRSTRASSLFSHSMARTTAATCCVKLSASGGLSETTERLSASDGERIIRLVAHHVGAEVHAGRPRVSIELQQVVRRNLNIQPTQTIRPGFTVRVIVNRDLILEPYGDDKWLGLNSGRSRTISRSIDARIAGKRASESGRLCRNR